MQLLHVSLNQILVKNPEAGRFSFLFESDVVALAESIKKIGLIIPPVLRRAGDNFEIICGCERAKAHEHYGSREMPALVYDHAELSDEQCLWLNLTHGEGAGRLSPVEQAIVLQKFSEVGYDMIRLMMEIGPRVGLPQSFSYVENHLRLLSLESEILRAIHKGEFGVEQAFLLCPVESKIRLPLFGLLQSCKANVNETRELIPLILDTAAIKGIGPAEFLAGEVAELLSREPEAPRKRLQILRDYLRKERYPSLSAVEAEFQEVVGRLALGGGSRIEAPKYFEGDEIIVTIRAANAEHLDEVARKLASPEARENMRALFRIVKGGSSHEAV